jgi:hypothetical protein
MASSKLPLTNNSTILLALDMLSLMALSSDLLGAFKT